MSESDWTLGLTLSPTGEASIVVGAGRSTPSILQGAWSADRDQVVVRYQGRVDTLVYRQAVSTMEFGHPGQLPALVLTGDVADESVFVEGFALWRVEDLARLPDPLGAQ